jgi:hypothetical protein
VSQEPTTLELIVQAGWFAACFAAPVAIYLLAVGCARACARLRRYWPGAFERDWRRVR